MWAYSDHRGQLSLLFATDLDNTLLFSKKHRKPGDHCVEWLGGKEQGYFSTETIRLLRLIAARAEIIPITTRSIAQYQRIVWPKGCRPRRAITTNGAYLFEDNTPVPAWREAMRASAERLCRKDGKGIARRKRLLVQGWKKGKNKFRLFFDFKRGP